MSSAPPSVAAPVTASTPERPVPWALPTPTVSLPAEPWVKVPLTVRLPSGVPGDTTPPLLTNGPETLPFPARVSALDGNVNPPVGKTPPWLRIEVSVPRETLLAALRTFTV